MSCLCLIHQHSPDTIAVLTAIAVHIPDAGEEEQEPGIAAVIRSGRPVAPADARVADILVFVIEATRGRQEKAVGGVGRAGFAAHLVTFEGAAAVHQLPKVDTIFSNKTLRDLIILHRNPSSAILCNDFAIQYYCRSHHQSATDVRLWHFSYGFAQRRILIRTGHPS